MWKNKRRNPFAAKIKGKKIWPIRKDFNEYMNLHKQIL